MKTNMTINKPVLRNVIVVKVCPEKRKCFNQIQYKYQFHLQNHYHCLYG